MAFQFYMPDIGEGVVEGEIVAWKVKEGDHVALDQPLVEVMTDKATVELPSPRAGTIVKIHYQDGQICPVGQVLVVIEEDHPKTAAKAAAPEARPAAEPARGAGDGNGRGPRPAAPPAPASPPGPSAAAAFPPGPSIAAAAPSPPATGGAIQVVDATAARQRVLATPATRRLARQLGVEIGRVPPTGPHGRVTTADVRGFQANGGAPQRAEPAEPAAPASPAQHPPIAIARAGEEERIPLRGIRKRIAESMARSVHTAAHFTYVEEVDMTDLVTVRERARARAAERGIKLNYLPFIVKAVVSGLKKWPQLNASLDETTQEIVRKKYYHIGIAVQGPQGLTVTVVRGGQIVARHMMNLSISVDHRLADGWDGAMFVQEVKSLLEDPTTMFMEMV